MKVNPRLSKLHVRIGRVALVPSIKVRFTHVNPFWLELKPDGSKEMS